MNSDGNSPLHIAIKRENFNIAKLLLRYRPECAEVQDKNQNLALHLALSHAAPDMVKVLFAAYPKGAVLQNSAGDLPIHLALKWKDFSILRVLKIRFTLACYYWNLFLRAQK